MPNFVNVHGSITRARSSPAMCDAQRRRRCSTESPQTAVAFAMNGLRASSEIGGESGVITLGKRVHKAFLVAACARGDGHRGRTLVDLNRLTKANPGRPGSTAGVLNSSPGGFHDGRVPSRCSDDIRAC